jgi:adenosylcobyric acid synthase
MSQREDTEQKKVNISGHGGNVHLLARNKQLNSRKIIDFSANINPLGPPEWLRAVISSTIEKLVHYPDPESYDLVQAIAGHLHVPA